MFYSLYRKISLLVSLPLTIFFNFYYLPFRQAIKLPIILYFPRFYALKGKIIIDSQFVKFGMIRMGLFNSPILQKKGFSWMNEGGTVIFRGNASFGAGTVLKIGTNPNAMLVFGNNFGNAIAVNIDCNYKIIFGYNVLIGWDTIIMDSSMHRLKTSDGKYAHKGYDEVYIGNDNWITTKCIILPGTKTPNKSVIATNSLLNKDYSAYPEYSLFAGSPAKQIKTGVWRDITDNSIKFD